MANAVKTIAKFIKKNPDSADAEILKKFCAALEDKSAFDLESLFALKSKTFEMALDLLDEWRFDRHVASRRLQKYLDQDED